MNAISGAAALAPRHHFNDLIARTLSELPPPPRSLPIELPPDYRRVTRAEKTGVLSLHNTFYRLPQRGELRAVAIASPKIDIVTVFFYPEPELALPLLATEFVVLGPRPIVGVIDRVCLLPDAPGGGAAARELRELRAAFPQLLQADDPPPWFQQCRSGDDFFVRPRHQQDLDDLCRAHLRLWSRTLALSATPARLGAAAALAHAEKIQDYKRHHRVNSPGLRLMNRSFGTAWTDDYMRNYLFA